MNVSQRRDIIKAAFRARLRLVEDDGSCFCIFDAVQRAGLDVRFLPLDSLEGMYCKSVPPTVMISSRRPEGRQRFTCAHEFAHHNLRHEASLDPVEATATSRSKDQNEAAANLFASALLMPATLIQMLFRRQLSVANAPTPLDAFAVASAIGVGYSTLVTHMRATLQILPAAQFDHLGKAPPKSIRQSLGIPDEAEQLVLYSRCWSGRPLDVRSGGYVFATSDAPVTLRDVPGLSVNARLPSGTLYKAGEVGVYPVPFGKQLPAVRVYDQSFAGRARFRFTRMEEEREDV